MTPTDAVPEVGELASGDIAVPEVGELASGGHDDTVSADVAGGPSRSGEGGALLAGRYRLLELLGSGGMGTVYRAHDTELDEVVALKTLRREVIDAPGALERFRLELKLARRITHRGVARAFDIGEHAGERFLTMEYVDGQPLSAGSSGARLPPVEVVRIVLAVADALGAAHEAGVVHRDLKPDNIMLARDGRVVLTDFGVARALDATGARATVAGGVVGTPAYMAPEQLEGRDVDGRADLYALGLVLFELLTGRLPFEGATPMALAAARLVVAPSFVELRARFPAALVSVVERCLARAPAERFATAGELAAALTQVAPLVADLPVPSARVDGGPPRAAGPTPPAAAREQRLAVMPLRWIGPADQAWIAEGLADDLVDSLALTRGLRVRARTGGVREGDSPAAFGQREEVDVVVDGTLRPALLGRAALEPSSSGSEQVRATLRLVSVADGFQLWTHRFEAAVGELFSVSDQAAQAIAAALGGASHDAPPREGPPPEAVELYLRARPMFASVPVGVEPMEFLDRALDLAPDDATILSAYAIGASLRAAFPGGKPEWTTRGQRAAERAVALAPHLPDAHVALARTRYAENRAADAVRALRVARAASANSAEAEQLLGRIVADLDQVEAAAGHLERALWLNSAMQYARGDLVRLEFVRGRPERAAALLEEIRRDSPDHYAFARFRLSLWLGRLLPAGDGVTHPALVAFGRLAEAAVTARRLDEDALAIVIGFATTLPPGSSMRRVMHQSRADLYGYLGDPAASLAALGDAVGEGLWDLTWVRHAPTLEGLRADPRFAELRAEVEQRAAPIAAAYRGP